MSRKSFLLTSLAAAILLAFGGVSVQADLSSIISNADSQVIDVQAGETINANGANGVDIVNPNVTLNNDDTILSNQSAVSTSAPGTIIDNIGLIDGDLDGVNFVNGLGAGDLINQDGATIQSDSRATNIGGVNFTQLGSQLDDDLFNVGAALDFLNEKGMTISISYEGEYGSNEDSQLGSVPVKYRF